MIIISFVGQLTTLFVSVVLIDKDSLLINLVKLLLIVIASTWPWPLVSRTGL